MTTLRCVAAAVILCLVATAAPCQEPVSAPQLQQMVSIVRYLQDRVASESSASLLSGDERFQALLESLRLFGMDVPEGDVLHQGMTPVELAVALLKGAPPARREVMVRDVARFLAAQPEGGTAREGGAGDLVRGRAILGLSRSPATEALPVVAAPVVATEPLPVAAAPVAATEPLPVAAAPITVAPVTAATKPPRQPVVLPLTAQPESGSVPPGTLDYGRLKSRIRTLFGNLTLPDSAEAN